ncbi:MAG: histidine kinase [Pedobacter sp.]|nr:MAG: histidine kinase [Pedobacter sp.]
MSNINIVELEINNKNRWVYFSKNRWMAHVAYWIWVMIVGTILVVDVPLTPSIFINHFILDNLVIASFFYLYCLYLIPYYFKRGKHLQFWLLVAVLFFSMPAVDVFFNKTFVTLSYHQRPNTGFLDSYFGSIGGFLLNFLLFSMMLFFMEKNEEGHTLIELEKEKQEIEQVKLDMLKTNISPDFLMRSLSQLKQAAIAQDDGTPESILTFSDLLRYRLYTNRRQHTTLQEEVDALGSFIHFIELNHHRNNLKINFQIQGTTEGKGIAPLALINILEPFCKAISNQPVTLAMILLIDDDNLVLEMDYSLRAGETLLADLQQYGDNYHQLYGNCVKFTFENCEDNRCLISLTLPVTPAQHDHL